MVQKLPLDLAQCCCEGLLQDETGVGLQNHLHIQSQDWRTIFQRVLRRIRKMPLNYIADTWF